MPFETLISAIHLLQAFKVKLWHDSPYVSKQLTGIGPKMSGYLVERGLNTFEKLLETNPRDIEFCVKRNPPFGSYLLTEVTELSALLNFCRTNCRLPFADQILAKVQTKLNTS